MFSINAPDEISLPELTRIVSRRKRVILRNVIVAAAVSVPLVLLLPVKYKAESVILTPQPGQPSLASMAQLSGTGAAAVPGLSLLSGFALRNPADLYMGMLKSRTIADALIEQFRLKDVYGTQYLVNARKRLARNTTIDSGKDTLIHVVVEDSDPRRAAAIANAYMEELSKQNSRLAMTEASQRRLFYETQLSREKDALADAEIGLRNTQQTTGLILPGGQAEALIRSGAQLRAEILSRQAEVEAMRTYATDDNPRYQIVRRELSVLQGELAKIERGGKDGSSLELPTGQLPEATLKYMRKLRDVKYHETLYEILSKQYEAARLDEAKSAPLVQVVDRAVVPEKRSWPPRTILVLSTIFLVAISTGFWILIQHRRDPAQAGHAW
jgi:tyrosine-protein kinase Etk/Wzc